MPKCFGYDELGWETYYSDIYSVGDVLVWCGVLLALLFIISQMKP